MNESILSEYGLTIDGFLECFEKVAENEESFEFLKDAGFINKLYKDEYLSLLSSFKELHKDKVDTERATKDNQTKGKVLENLVNLLFTSCGGFFKCKRNLRTSTNEIDVLIETTPRFELFSRFNLVNKNLVRLICECKNHAGSVKVDYVGKFYSLTLCSGYQVGIMFSYKGLSGRNRWDSSKGLVRKIYMLSEGRGEPVMILDFTYNDFVRYGNGESIFKILDEKCKELEIDSNITDYIQKHPCEEVLKQYVNSLE